MENKIKTVVPTLRFPEFRGTEGWENDTIDNLIDIIVPPKKIVSQEYLSTGKYPIIDQSQNYICGWTNDKTALITDSSLKQPIIIFGDHTCILKKVVFPFAQGADGIKILKAKNCIDGNFLYQALLANPVIQEEYKRHYSILKQKIIFYPSINFGEQQKIANCLSSLDDLIEATAQKVEALKEHKKGLMQRLFPAKGKNVPDLRFPEFQGTSVWEEKKLGKIGNFIGGGTPNTTNPEYWDGEILWYTPTEIKNGYLKSSNRKITKQGLKNSSAKLLPKGAILITTRATIGDVAISKKECTTNQGFQSLVVNDSEINLFWFYWIIQHKEELIKKASGSTFKEIGKNERINIIAYSAKKQEQQKIADCLSSIDELIEATTRKIEVLKEHKKGLMQQLFPKI